MECGVAPQTTTCAYDNAGRREGFSYPSGGAVVRDLRRYVHDGEAVLAELGESPGGGHHPVQRYLHGIGVLARERLDDAAVPTRRPDADPVPARRPGADPVPARRPGADPGSNPTSLQTLFHHTDGLGSTVNVTGSDGSVKNAYLYDAWGNNRELEAGGACITAPDLGIDGFSDRDAYLGRLASAFAEDDNRLTFTGLEAEPETGLYFAQSRFYDPEAGRFLSEDADPGDEGAPVSLHRYLYANASPTRFVDPSGRSSEDTVPTASLEMGDLGSPESAARPSSDQDLPEGGSLAAYEVAKSKSRWPLSLSRSAPQHQGIWPECVSRAMDQWQEERDPDFDPIAKLRRVYHQVRSKARETYERTLRYAEDQWQQLKSDPFGFAGRKLNDIGELVWNLTFQPVIDAGKAGWEWASDPSKERFGKLLFNTAMALPGIGGGIKAFRSGIAVGRQAFGKLTSLWAKEGAEELGERLRDAGFSSLKGLGWQNSEYKRFRLQGYSEAASQRLIKPYSGEGQHFVQKAVINRTINRLGSDSVSGRFLNWYKDSAFNLVRGRGMNTGRFYEYHSRLHSLPAFGPRTAQGMRLLTGEPWRSANIIHGLEPYGKVGYIWHGSPLALKITFGAALGSSTYSLYRLWGDDQ